MNSRDTRIDFLRVILIIAVVGIHTLCVLDYADRPVLRTISLSLNTIFHCAVPMFVMISGMMFVNREISSVNDFYEKRASRILIPFIPISLFYVLIRIFRDHEVSAKLAREIVLGAPYYHLWFASSIIAVYLLIPILQRIAVEIKARYILPVCLLFIYVTNITGAGPYQIGMYAPYALLGMVLARLDLYCISNWIYVALIAILVMSGYVNIGMVLKSGSVHSMGYGYPLIMVESTIAMMLFLRFAPIFGEVWTKLAKLSFGVYLIHPMVKPLADLILRQLPPRYDWFSFPIVVIGAFAAVWLGARSRLGAKVLGVK